MKKSSYLGMFFIVLILFAASVPFSYGQIEEWVARYNGPGNYYDYAQAIAVDSSGNVYVTGSSYDSDTSLDYATIKYDADGNEGWVRLYDGTGNGLDYAQAIAVDNSGNVYVTGYSVGSDTDYDYATIKYDADGNEGWVRRYDGPGNGSDYASALTVDANGNVYVTGRSYGSGTDYDYATIKYDADGNEGWIRRYNGPGNSSDRPNALAVDADGNVYVTGGSYGSGTYDDYATIKYDTDGNEGWVARYHWFSRDYASALTVDGAGNVYVTGSSYGSGSGMGYGYATIKYDTAGDELWLARYDGPANGCSIPPCTVYHARDLAVDADGNVYVTGYSYNPGGGADVDFDYATIKYFADGNEGWVACYEGLEPFSEWPLALAVDPNGNAYVTGRSRGDGGDYITFRYDATGNPLWTARYDGSSYDYASALTLDGAGNVYVTGTSYGSGTYDDYATVKYSQIPTRINELITLVGSFNLQQGIENSLDAKLQNVFDALDAANAGQRQDAINKIQAFINSVEAQRGNALTEEQADTLIGIANEIILLL